ncbi:hypothetical protein, partial [Blastococcus sp. TF02A-26]|uniref:hypothetical protein n=1 Tax=Blastococcus sp. TF02A-26 TaxID=2250577 RepID=UPI001F1BC570
RHAQLPHRGSVKDQPKQLSTINRNTVAPHPKPRGQASGETTHHREWAPWGSNPQPADYKVVRSARDVTRRDDALIIAFPPRSIDPQLLEPSRMAAAS